MLTKKEIFTRLLLTDSTFTIIKYKKCIGSILGGSSDSSPNRLDITFEGSKYYLDRPSDEEEYYVLASTDDYSVICVAIHIDREMKSANIINISSGKYKCLKGSQKIGTKLLKLAIEIMGKYKQVFGIESIIVSDHSFKTCKGKSIKLPELAILLTGHTWYGKYGFRPYIIEDNKIIIDEYQNKRYHENIKIMDNITLDNIRNDFEKLISLELPENYKNMINNIIINKPNMLVKDFLKIFLKDFDYNCQYFYKFYDKLFDIIKLHRMGTFFALFLESNIT